MDITETQRKKAIEALKNNGVLAAYVFGSTVRGSSDAGSSDVDIAVVFSSELSRREQFECEGRVVSSLDDVFDGKADVIVIHRRTDPLLKHRAVLGGELLYSADDMQRKELERAVLHEFEDTRHLRVMHGRAVRNRIREGRFGKPAPHDRA